MSKWSGCPVVCCKNDLCHTGCQALKDGKASDVTAEYAKQIVKAVNDYGDDGLSLVTDLLKEYGAKAYKQGRAVLVAEISRIA